MSVLDWLIILIYFLLVIFAGISISAVSLAALVAVIIAVRLIRGERIPR